MSLLLSALNSLSEHPEKGQPRVTAAELNALPPSIQSLLSHLVQVSTENNLNKLKITSLRSSLSSLSSHLSSTSSALSSAQQDLLTLKSAYTKDYDRVCEERDGYRALSVVWEGRWREERRGREELESAWGSSRASENGRVLNRRGGSGGGAGLVVTNERAIFKSLVPSPSLHLRSSSSASSSSSDSQNGPHTQFRHSTTPTPPKRMKARQIVGDITRELERVRREGDRLLGERDDEIKHLELVSFFRSKELSNLYSSLDTVFSLSAPLATVLPPSFQLTVEEEEPSRPGSVLDRTPFREAKKASLERGKKDGKGKGKEREDDTIKLEMEVRELEKEVLRMGGDVSAVEISPHPSSTSGGESSQELKTIIRTLNTEIESLERRLKEVTKEREKLKKLVGSSGDNGPARDPTLPEGITLRYHHLEEELFRAQERVDHLTTERDQLSARANTLLVIVFADIVRNRLLAQVASLEAHNTHLSTSLISSQTQIEDISERVRLKLVEQKKKLEECWVEIERGRAREKVLEGLLGWREEEGRGERRRSDGDLMMGEEREWEEAELEVERSRSE